jgi:hypothetical protein
MPQGEALQKRGSWVHDVIEKNNFRTHQGRDQESLLVKQR